MRDPDTLQGIAGLAVLGLFIYAFIGFALHDLTGSGLPGTDLMFDLLGRQACAVGSQRPGSCEE
jgi:hypothetical protein